MKRQSNPVSVMYIFFLVVLLLVVSNQVLCQETVQKNTDSAQEPAAAPAPAPPPQSSQPDSTPSHNLAIAKTGSGQGRVWSTPQGASFKKGTVVTIHAAPDLNSVFESWSGACSGTNRACTVTMTGDKSVTAVFVLKTYIIYVRPPVNGVIHPFGSIKVGYGEKRRFQIIPLPGYRVSEVFVDKASVGVVNTYTFSNIAGDHTIEAVFVKE